MKGELKATTVRSLLTALLVLTILGACAGFYAGLRQVREIAVDVTHASQDASAGNNQVEELQELQVQLEKTRTLVQKADTMFVPLADYQGQVLTDLRAYASASGISITNTEFGDSDVASATTGETRPVTITFAQPLSYSGLLRFLQLTEGSLPKITVNGVTVSRPSDASGDQVNVAPITLRISVK